METIYLNHAGTSWPKPSVVTEAASAVFQTDPGEWPELFQRSHECVADFFGVDSSRLLVTPSCTGALQLAITDQPWQPGDRVITSHFEHHALYRNLVKLQDRGVQVTVLPSDDRQLFTIDALEDQLKRGAVRMVAMTAACNVTGHLLPVAEATKLAHQYGALMLVDAAQVAAWWDLGAILSEVDLLTFAGHKGPQSPWGVGGLYVRADLPMQCPTAACDVAEIKDRPATDTMPGYCDAGSVNLGALAGLAAGCRWLSEPAQRNRLSDAQNLAELFAVAMRRLTRVNILHDSPIESRTPTVAITIEGRSAGEAGKLLRESGIFVSAGFQCAPQAHRALGTTEAGVVRFSFGPTNTESDVQTAAEAVAKLA